MPARARAAALAAAALAVAAAAPCAYPFNLNGTEVWGLTSAPAGAPSPAACAAACCAAGASCEVWQWCAGGAPDPPAGCGAAPACWVGAAGGDARAVPGWVSASSAPAAGPFVVNASARAPPPAPVPGVPPATSPAGVVLTLTSRGLARDGVPLLPYAGELHPSRVPAGSWDADLGKMKAGGLDVVSAYVSWLHVEDARGAPDWSGGRNLTAFLLAAQRAGLLVALRIGPWCHGELRNGGFPNWLQASGVKLRTNNSAFMAAVRPWYAGVAAQMRGLAWSEGGPVVSVQLDNETPDVDYLLALRQLAVDVGINPPFFTKTGWPDPDKPVPVGTMVPLFGGYPDNFWDRGVDNATGGFLFARPPALAPYPYFTVEVGGGMASSYHRRILVDPVAVAAAAATYLAGGAAQVGFYMYHGGTDPVQSTTTQEQQGLGEGGANDMPMRTYDFHAPVGEAGQVRPHFHLIRRTATLARLFAPWLARTSSFLPAVTPSGPADATTLRWAARGDGDGALLFLSVVQPFVALAPQTGVRLTVLLAGGAVVTVPAPASPAVDLPVGAFPVWAVRPPAIAGDASNARLEYATATPLGVVPDDTASGAVAVFYATTGVRAEFAFNATTAGGSPLRYNCVPGRAACAVVGGLLFARNVTPGIAIAFTLTGDGGFALGVLLLDDVGGSRAWIAPLGPSLALFMTGDPSAIIVTTPTPAGTARGVGGGAGAGASVALSLITDFTAGQASAPLWVLPPPRGAVAPAAGGAPLPPTPDGAFARYDVPLPSAPVTAAVAATAAAGAPRVVPRGPSGVAAAPAGNGSLADFAAAAAWTVSLSGAPPPGVDVRLAIAYDGDCARVYAGAGRHAPADVLMDHFWNGHPLELPLTRAGVPVDGAALELRVLPLAPAGRPGDAPVYFEAAPRRGAPPALTAVDVVHTATVGLTFAL